MVIDFNTSNGANGTRSTQTGSANAKRDVAEAPRPDEQAGGRQDVASDGGVRLSSQAQQLQVIEDGLRDLPVIDEQRVAQIRQAISDGSYQVDSTRIADKLLALEE